MDLVGAGCRRPGGDNARSGQAWPSGVASLAKAKMTGTGKHRRRWAVILIVGLLVAALAGGVLWFDLRRSGDPGVRRLLEQAITPQEVKRWPEVTAAIESGEPIKGDSAIERLVAMGPQAVDTLTIALRDPDLDIRLTAAYVLGLIGDRRAVPALIAAVEERRPQQETTYWDGVNLSTVALALARIGDERALHPLLEALRDRNCTVGGRAGAAKALGRLGAKPKLVIPALVEVMQDLREYGLVRSAAIRALGDMGRPAKVAVPEISAVLERGAYHMECFAAGDALAKLGEAPRLMRFLRSEHLVVRLAAAIALADHGTGADTDLSRTVVPVLAKGIQDDKEGTYHSRVADALSRIGPEAKDATPALIRLARNGPPVVQERAARALGRIGPAASAAIPVLSKLATGKLDSYPSTAEGFINPKAPLIVKAVGRQLARTRETAAEALKLIQGQERGGAGAPRSH